MDLMAIASEPVSGEATAGETLAPAAGDPNPAAFAAVFGQQVKQLLELLTAADTPAAERSEARTKSEEEPRREEGDSITAAVCNAGFSAVPGAAGMTLSSGLDTGCSGAAPAPLAELPDAAIGTTAGQPPAAEPAGEMPKRRLGLESFADTLPEGWEALFRNEEAAPKAGSGQSLSAKASGLEAIPDSGQPTTADTVQAETEPEPGPGKPDLKTAVSGRLPATTTAVTETETTGQDQDTGRTLRLRPVARGNTETETAAVHLQLRPESLREALPATAGASSKPPLQASWTPAQVLTRLSEVQKQMVVEHFTHAGAGAMSRGGNEAIWVDLYPPELGRVRVLVESSGPQVNAVLTVQDPGVRDLFQEQMGALRRGLEESGLKLGELSVEIRQDAKPDARSEVDAPAAKKAPYGWEPKSTAAAQPQGWTRAWPLEETGRVDMMV